MNKTINTTATISLILTAFLLFINCSNKVKKAPYALSLIHI